MKKNRAAWLLIVILLYPVHDLSADGSTGSFLRRKVQFEAPDFTLTDQERNSFELKDVNGKKVLLTFGYSSCPDICPVITAELVRLQKDSGLEKKNLHVLWITTDPETDKPEALKAYGKRFGVDFKNWSFLSGSRDELKKVWGAYKINARPRGRGLVDHTTATYLIDSKGTVRFVYRGTTLDEKSLLKDLQSVK